MTASSEYISVKEAAAELGVSPSTVWRWIDARRLPAIRIGPKMIRIRRRDLGAAHQAARLALKGPPPQLKARRMTKEEQHRWRAWIELAQANADAIQAAHGGKIFSDTTPIIRRDREERSRRL